MSGSKKQYTNEFKIDVAKATHEEGATLKSVAEKFDVHPTLVRNWKIKYGSGINEITINGRMKVKTLKSQFLSVFGLTMRMYNGRSFADENATLASIRKGEGESNSGEFSPKKNTKVGNVEDKIMELFGLKTQISGSDDSYLCDNDLTLAKAKEIDETKMARKEQKANTVVKEMPLTRSSELSIDDIGATSEGYIPQYGRIISFKDFLVLISSFDNLSFSTQEIFNTVFSDEGGISGGASQVVILSGNEYEPEDGDYVEGVEGERIYKGQPYSIVFLPNEKVVLLDDDEDYEEFIGFIGGYYAQHAPDVISGEIDWSEYGISDIEEGLNQFILGVIDIVNEEDEQNENITEFLDSNNDTSLQTECNVNLQVEDNSISYAGIWYVKSEKEISIVNESTEVSYFDTLEFEDSQETIATNEVYDFVYDKLFDQAQEGCDSCSSSMAILQRE